MFKMPKFKKITSEELSSREDCRLIPSDETKEDRFIKWKLAQHISEGEIQNIGRMLGKILDI